MDGYVRPGLTRTQLPPPLTLLKSPLIVPAYTVAGVTGSIAMAETVMFVRPVLTAVQLPPPLTLLNTPPPPVPAYTVAGVAGSIARTLTFRFVRPVLTAVQLPPPLTLLNTPPAAVPAYTVAGVKGSTARTWTYRLVRPVLAGVQFPPPLALLNTPPPLVPAYTVAGVTGSTARALTMPPSGPLLVQTLTPAEATPSVRPREATTRNINRAFESDSIGNSFLISVASGHGGCSRNRPNFAQSKKLKQSPRDACFVRLQGKRLSLVKLLVESSKRGQGARPVVYLLVGSGRPAAQCATFMKVYRSP